MLILLILYIFTLNFHISVDLIPLIMSSPFLLASLKITPITHTDVERRRREKLSKLFIALRHVVQTNKSSSQIIKRSTIKTLVLEDAVAVINELKTNITALEFEGEILRSQIKSPERIDKIEKMGVMEHKLLNIEVTKVGKDVMLIRMQSDKMNHPAARLMTVLKELDFEIGFASLSVIENITIQHVTILMSDTTDRILYTKDQLVTVLNAKLVRFH